MKKRFVLSGYFGFKNFGDEAILSVLIDRLRLNKGLISVISSNPEYTKSQYEHIRAIRTFDFYNIIWTIFKSDILISGGGSLLQDVTSFKSLIYYLLIIFIALFLRKKVIIFAQGIGPINSKIGQFLTKLLLRHCTYISVRDKKSYELLLQWGINSDLVCDPIFLLQIPQVEKTKVVAVQLRDCKGMSMDFLDRLAYFITKNFGDYEINIYSLQDSIDLSVCEYFQKNLKMLNPDINISLYSNLTNSQIIDRISQAQYLIAMRFHALIIGLLSKTKIMAINYDIKVENLAKEFNISLIGLKNGFKDKFDLLKAQNSSVVNEKVREKKFDWTGFDNAVC